MEIIKIGKIVNAVALKGEVKIYSYSDRKERFEELERILVKKNERLESYQVEGVRYQKGMVILKLRDVDDRNKAEALKESDVCITEEDLKALPEDTFYVRDLIGCDVFNTEDGARIGAITDVLQNTAQDLYQVTTKDGKEILIPAVENFIKKVNTEEGCVWVKPIPGLID